MPCDIDSFRQGVIANCADTLDPQSRTYGTPCCDQQKTLTNAGCTDAPSMYHDIGFINLPDGSKVKTHCNVSNLTGLKYVSHLRSIGGPHMMALHMHVGWLKALGADHDARCKALSGAKCNGQPGLMCEPGDCTMTTVSRGEAPCAFDCNYDDCMACFAKSDKGDCTRDDCKPEGGGGRPGDDLYCTCKQSACAKEPNPPACMADPLGAGTKTSPGTNPIQTCCSDAGSNCDSELFADGAGHGPACGNPDPNPNPPPPGPDSKPGDPGNWSGQMKDTVRGRLKQTFPDIAKLSHLDIHNVNTDQVVNCALGKISNKFSYTQIEGDNDPAPAVAKQVVNILNTCVKSLSNGTTGGNGNGNGNGKGKGLSTGAIIGIVAGSLLLLGGLIALFMSRKKNRGRST